MAIFPLGWTVWESLHRHDLRMPWLGKPFVGIDNYTAVLGDERFREAVLHTAFFTGATVTLEILLGLFLALSLNRAFRGLNAARAAMLVPWALPTVVAALVWRFMFESDTGLVNGVLTALGVLEQPLVWFARAGAAWIPLIAADVWKTTPFVALLILAALQNIPDDLYQAASIDGASPWRQTLHITLPLLRPALLVALIFRTLDAFRVFDLVYAMTGGGPGTSTEPIALYTFNALFQDLRFGYASALAVLVFVITAALVAIYVRLLGAPLEER
jgi:ABC-type sugar transport system permease subunit